MPRPDLGRRDLGLDRRDPGLDLSLDSPAPERPGGGRTQLARGRDPQNDRPMPIDEQIDAMTGDALAARLRRAPLARIRRPPGSQVAADPVVPLALADFHDLRRLGLFGDDGRNPPPSWWAR